MRAPTRTATPCAPWRSGYALDNIEHLHQQASRISVDEMQKHAEEKITNMVGEIADNLYNEAKR
ncbi:MAG TPA: hypothetical protein VES70_21740 [Pseudomonas sp.]|nr:hypothetical protein [Pseudomonas sp.]